MTRICPRTLDKPILLFGLEVEDLAIVLIIGGGGGVLFGPVLPGLASIAAWIFLVRFKRDKPAGYILHYLYAKGSDLPGLIPSPNKVRKYGVYARHSITQF